MFLGSDLSWAEQVDYAVQKAWRALHFVMRIVKRGNKNTKSLAYTSLVRPIPEYGTAFWEPYGGPSLGTLGSAKKDSKDVCALQSV
jgi:hypothetical protein